jgi:hypothetical protein
MTKSFFFLCALLGTMLAAAQDSVLHRVILIGDAGEMDAAQQSLIPDAAGRVLPGRSTVLYLGDNIYPRGIGMPGSPDQSRTENILRSQWQPLRAAGAAVYFIPGNHDWDRMGKNGLAKIKRQWQFVQEQQDSLLQLVPPNGCPDPVAIPIGDSLVIIAFDSEWWLFPFDKQNPQADCDCQSRDEVLARFNELFYENRYKMILLAAHHPFQSYGTHGGRFSLKDHLFPLTVANKNLYIPLPVIGSLYPLLRKTFTNPEDLGHPLYKDMRRRIDLIMAQTPNLVHVAGHEHGLQLIRNAHTGQTQVVSGSGAKLNYTIKGKHSLFGEASNGYVIADWYKGNKLVLKYYTLSGNQTSLVYQYEVPYHDIAKQELNTYRAIQGDSMTVRIRPEYDSVSGLKRKLFGENYRKEFAASVTLPVIRLSQLHGGLTPQKRGGGMQTISLRLQDAKGREWVLRNLEKNPDPLLPEELRGTFARDFLDDYMSAQNPFAPLVVPVLANAAEVPHANPVIGIVAPDTLLGKYQRLFAGKVALLEEREPAGKSDNTPEMMQKVLADNDNTVDTRTFLRARLLDLLISDWDRHPDQWRWADTRKGKEKHYVPVPRDRDQALYIREGVLPQIASRSWVLPTLQGFGSRIPKVKYSLIKSSFISPLMADQWNYEDWMNITQQFVTALSDSVIEKAFHQLPAAAFNLRGERLIREMKERRDQIPAAMKEYYHFVSKIVDIRGTQKNEFIQITGAEDGGLHITARKINKEGELKDQLMDRHFDPSVTKEVRIYLEAGRDSVVVENNSSNIKIRLIGGEGYKAYQVNSSKKKIRLYDQTASAHLHDAGRRIRSRLSSDTAITSFVPVNLYHITMPLITAGYNLDDGLIFGMGFKHTHQGFRKVPYASTHQLLAAHSFSTKAYKIRYKSEWMQVAGKADLLLQALIKAPDNTQNFFGRGNNTPFYKTDGFLRYYRARFSIYQAEAALRWRSAKGTSLSIGPAMQLYRYDSDENEGRFISNAALIGSYDSSSIEKHKLHLGLVLNFENDTRNNALIPTWGSLVKFRIQGYQGMNTVARSFIQINPEISIYKALNTRRSIILAERLGGGITIGKTAFYQSQFIGGHENLLGYRQYRFAGQHALFNNLELRIKLADFASYILPGQFGLTGFFDIGRVWEPAEESRKWHNGYGGGIYYAPARMAILQLVAGYSKEGWLPYFTVGFRF